MTSQIVMYKPEPETVFELELKSLLYGPREDNNENLYVCNQIGEIIRFSPSGEHQVILSYAGQPTCIGFPDSEDFGTQANNSKNSQQDKDFNFYLADVANSVIYEKKSDKNEDEFMKSDPGEAIVKDYNGRPLFGPTSLAYNHDDNLLFFCDAGNFETTSLDRKNGSLYFYDIESKYIKPLLENCLAYPADIFYDNVIGVGYVCETFNNRILKISRNPSSEANLFQISVFYVFNGRVGPTALACDEEGNIYCSRFEYQNTQNDVNGLISVINRFGNLVGEIIVPKMPEINGMFIPREDENKDTGKNESYIYFTERNFSGVKRIKLSSFVFEVSKITENLKIY